MFEEEILSDQRLAASGTQKGEHSPQQIRADDGQESHDEQVSWPSGSWQEASFFPENIRTLQFTTHTYSASLRLDPVINILHASATLWVGLPADRTFGLRTKFRPLFRFRSPRRLGP